MTNKEVSVDHGLERLLGQCLAPGEAVGDTVVKS